VRAYLESGEWRKSAVEVKRNRRRVVYRCSLPDGGPVLFLKEDIAASLFDWVKTWFRRKAEMEFTALQEIRAAGVPAARAIGWGSTARGGILATEEVRGRDLRSLIIDGEIARLPDDHGFLDGLACFVSMLVRSGMEHPDLHAGNIIVDGDLCAPKFALLDLYGVRLRRDRSVEDKLRLLFWLVPLLEELPPARRTALLQRVASGDPDAGSLACWGTLVRVWSQLRGAKWRGWRRRLLGDSSICRRRKDSRGCWLLSAKRGRYDESREVLSVYLAGDSHSAMQLKDDRKRRVARVVTQDGSYIVKEYRAARRRWLWRPDRRGWLNTARAHALSGRVARCCAWLAGRSGDGYLIQEDAGAACLYDQFATSGQSGAERRAWLLRLADALAFLHLSGCFHADLKLANWIVDAEESRLRIVDCDDVRFYRRLPEWARERNLMQIGESFPPKLTACERLRFVVLYGRIAGLGHERTRELAAFLPARVG
jgi:tRNA A-37 threonylcarbamoyl transferase component Bud32